MTPEELTQAYVAMSDRWKEDAERAYDGALATPSTHLKTLLQGIETQANKMIADGDEDAALQFLEHAWLLLPRTLSSMASTIGSSETPTAAVVLSC